MLLSAEEEWAAAAVKANLANGSVSETAAVATDALPCLSALNAVPTIHVCEECKSRNIDVYEKQTRGAVSICLLSVAVTCLSLCCLFVCVVQDEPMTQYFKCKNCEARWTEN